MDERQAVERKRKRDAEGNQEQHASKETPAEPIKASNGSEIKTREKKRRKKDGMKKADSDKNPSEQDRAGKPETLGGEMPITSSKRKRSKRRREKAENETRNNSGSRGDHNHAVDQSPIFQTRSEPVVGAEISGTEQRKPAIAQKAVEEVNASPAPPSSSITSASSDRYPSSEGSPRQSGSSSVTSIIPPASPGQQPLMQPSKEANSIDQKTSHASPEELKQRLKDRIDALRAARKADRPDGENARSRQELLDSRRKKEEARRTHKKEQRQKAKEEEARKNAEIIAKGSPLLSPASPMSASNGSNHNFSFGRVNFNEGERLTSDLSSIMQPRDQNKGPSDPASALTAAQKKNARLAGLDPEKKADILEKDVWLNAKKRAQGERIRDDGSLLKKTLKRKQKQKKKSEKEWRERLDNVKKNEEKRQKKREANLAKRKDEKDGKKGKGKKAGRPGFEGSFRVKAPSRDGKRRR